MKSNLMLFAVLTAASAFTGQAVLRRRLESDGAFVV